MGKIRWLHISDIHMNKRGVDNSRMRQKLIEYLENNNITCDYIFFTGDLRYAPAGEFDKDTEKYLKELCEAVGVEVNNLFIVPGNHDIDRDDVRRKQASGMLLESKENYNSKIGVIKDETIADLKSGREQFLDIIQELYADYPERIQYYTSDKILHFCIETKDFNVIHVDSTVTYTKETQRDFVIGTEQFMNALEAANPEKTIVILTHYSTDFLVRSEQKMIHSLLMDYHAQLWLAGHEHEELLRKQRDYFYEFQCGNLIYEGDDTRSCIAIGEYDSSEQNGQIQIHYWDSPKGWAVYPFASNQQDCSIYKFELMDDTAIEKQLSNAVKSEEFRKIAEDEYVFNIQDMTPEKVKFLEESGFLEMKNELGNRLNGNETEDEKVQMFLYELKSSLNSGKRYECMPIFQNVVRDVFDGYIYLDGNFAPFMKSTVTHFYFDSTDRFSIHNDSIHLEVVTENNQVIYQSFSYNLSRFDTAEERLYYFEKINHYMNSKKVFVKMSGHEEYNLTFDTAPPTKDWNENIEKTKFWMEQMRAIVEIEDFYKIKFKLPVKASEEEYEAIEILRESISLESSRILPGFPMKRVGLKRQFYLEKDIYIDNANYLPPLRLFGYLFLPVAQYAMHGDYYWNKKKKEWVTKDNGKEGVPVRVEFEVCFDEDRNRELVKRIPFEKVESEFADKTIVYLTGEDAKFFEKYVKITHDFQEIWQLYLSYKDQLEKLQKNDLMNQSDRPTKDMESSINDKITINNLTNDLISAGEVLVKHIDKLMNTLEFENSSTFSEEWMSENLVLCWFTIMRQFSMEGHFPIAVDSEGWGYYDLLTIKYEMKEHCSQEYLELMDVFEDAFKDIRLDLAKIPHYDLIRTYMLCIAEKQVKYYETLKPVLESYAQRMSEYIEQYPELVIQDGEFENYVAYELEDDKDIHVFRKNEDVMMDYVKFVQEAENHLGDCRIGMKEHAKNLETL